MEQFAEHYIAEQKEFNKTETIDNPIMQGQIFRYGYGGNATFEEYHQSVIGMPCFDRLKQHPRFVKITETLSETVKNA